MNQPTFLSLLVIAAALLAAASARAQTITVTPQDQIDRQASLVRDLAEQESRAEAEYNRLRGLPSAGSEEIAAAGARWRQIGMKLKAALADLDRLRRGVPTSAPDPAGLPGRIERAETELGELKRDEDLAEQQFKRMQALHERKLLSDAELAGAEARLKTLAARVRAAQAELDKLRGGGPTSGPDDAAGARPPARDPHPRLAELHARMAELRTQMAATMKEIDSLRTAGDSGPKMTAAMDRLRQLQQESRELTAEVRKLTDQIRQQDPARPPIRRGRGGRADRLPQ